MQSPFVVLHGRRCLAAAHVKAYTKLRSTQSPLQFVRRDTTKGTVLFALVHQRNTLMFVWHCAGAACHRGTLPGHCSRATGYDHKGCKFAQVVTISALMTRRQSLMRAYSVRHYSTYNGSVVGAAEPSTCGHATKTCRSFVLSKSYCMALACRLLSSFYHINDVRTRSYGRIAAQASATVGTGMAQPEHDVPWALMEAQQLQWARCISQVDAICQQDIRLIGGFDIQWREEDELAGVAALVVLNWPQLQVVHTAHAKVRTSIPYRSGFLGFRECDAYQSLFNTVRATPFQPQLLMVDGCGVLHPRQCGSACQLGLCLDMPCIGVSKTLNSAASVDEKQVKGMMAQAASCKQLIVDQHNNIIGCAVRKSMLHQCPVYVSVGHKICLDTAVDLVLRCCVYKIPEPIRQADGLARRLLKEEQR